MIRLFYTAMYVLFGSARHIEDAKQDEKDYRQHSNRYGTNNNQVANASQIILVTVLCVITFTCSGNCVVTIRRIRRRYQYRNDHNDA